MGAIRAALLRAEPAAETYLRFRHPLRSLVAATAADVPGLLAAAERAGAEGLWAVGFVAYEAAPGLDPALPVRGPASAPVAAFGLFGPPERIALASSAPPRPWILDLASDRSEQKHRDAIETIRGAIGAGETYQVNLTLSLSSRTMLPAEDLFAALGALARAPYAAFLDLGERAIVSLSPELFFEREGERLRMRPMKGTRPRGRFVEEDRALAAQLAAAEKDRAENLMIVDMARNDLGRVARAGSVAVTSLFDIERYPTVWQATSTIEASSDATLPELFGALFPCCSVTGAPKRAAMEWIAGLESGPRGAYCGAIGRVEPGGRARFSVAIRTAEVERSTGRLRYGVGSGVVWDSDAGEEWRECLAKGRALEPPDEDFALFETVLWQPRRGAPWLSRHLSRLALSAERFDRPCDLAAIESAFRARIETLSSVSHRIRIELAADGAVSVAADAFRRERRAWTIALVGPPVDPDDLTLFHKTTRRESYDAALDRARSLGADEPLLLNSRGEVTEGARSNLVLELDGRRLTPRRECGLLAGVFRAELLDRGRVAEAVVVPGDLGRARRVWMVNALRGWVPAREVWSEAGDVLWRAST